MIIVHIRHNRMYVKFDNLPTGADFQRLLTGFKNEFIEGVWDYRRKAWRLELTESPRLTWFAYRYFGYDAIRYDDGKQDLD